MSGTQLGGQRAAAKNIEKYGETFYADIGKIGGKIGRTGGFASDKVGADGLTGRQRAAIAGSSGGKKSRRTGVNSPNKPVQYIEVKKASPYQRLIQAIRKAA